MKELKRLLEEVANDAIKISNSTSYELQQPRMGALQNDMALDYLLAGRGGTCAIEGKECCTVIRAGFEVQQSVIPWNERAAEEWQKEENSS